MSSTRSHRTRTGRHILAVRPVPNGEGGQGKVEFAAIAETREEGIVKTLFPDPNMTREEQNKRIAFLVKEKLHEVSASFKTPVEQIDGGPSAGYFAPLAQGEPLNNFLDPPRLTLIQTLCINILISLLIVKLHARGIAHGDIRPENFFVDFGESGYKPEVSAIDLDNFSAEGAPPPRCYGDDAYLAPEVWDMMVRGKPACLDEKTDVFSLAVLFHTTLLLKHPTAGYDTQRETYVKALWGGRWLHDPYGAMTLPAVGGYPPGMLNSSLADLFRRGMSRDRDARPPAEEWCDRLVEALHRILACPVCENAPIINDATKTVCPYGNHPIPDLHVMLPDGRRIPIHTAYVPVGRAELGSSMVSRAHAVFRKCGLDTTVEAVSATNPTFRKVKGIWCPLRNNTPVSIEMGDMLRLANVEVRID